MSPPLYCLSGQKILKYRENNPVNTLQGYELSFSCNVFFKYYKKGEARGMIMIPMEETIKNLQSLSADEYDNISILISETVNKKKGTVSVEDALNFGEEMCSKYSDAFKVLAN